MLFAHENMDDCAGGRGIDSESDSDSESDKIKLTEEKNLVLFYV